LQNTLSFIPPTLKLRKYRNSNYVFIALIIVFSSIYALDELTKKTKAEVIEEVVIPYLFEIKQGNYLNAYNDFTSDRFKERYSYQDFVNSYLRRRGDLGKIRYFQLDEIDNERQVSAKVRCVFSYGYSGMIEIQVRRQWGKYYIDDTFERVGNKMERRAW